MQPNSTEFKKNELRTLDYLQQRHRLLRNYTDLYNEIYFRHQQYRSKGDTDYEFIFDVEFDFVVEGEFHKVVIAANIKPDFEMCSYLLALVGKGNDNQKVIRKFHFDYAKPTIATDQRVPTFHLQYGGRLAGQIAKYDPTYLSDWLSLPRLSYAPVNLALLLDILFCEFQSEETKEVYDDPDWRKLVYDNERFISNQYYQAINEYIRTSHNSLHLIRDLCYND